MTKTQILNSIRTLELTRERSAEEDVRLRTLREVRDGKKSETVVITDAGEIAAPLCGHAVTMMMGSRPVGHCGRPYCYCGTEGQIIEIASPEEACDFYYRRNQEGQEALAAIALNF